MIDKFEVGISWRCGKPDIQSIGQKIIHCNECKWAEPYEEKWFKCIETETYGLSRDDFCSRGEPKE